MSHGQTDADLIGSTHNTARFFTENRHIAWVLLVGDGHLGHLRLHPDAQAQRSGIPGHLRGGRVRLARRQRGAGRAARHPQARREDVSRTRTSNRSSRCRAAASRSWSSRSTSGPPSRRKNGTTSPCKLGDIHDLPPGSRARAVHQGFRRYRGADADGGEPESGRRRNRLCARGRFARPSSRPARACRNPSEPGAPRSSSPFRRRSIGAIAASPSRPCLLSVLTAQQLIDDARPLGGPGFVGLDFTAKVDRDDARRRAAACDDGAARAGGYHPGHLGRCDRRCDPAQTEQALTARRRRQYSLPRARPVHRPHQAHAADRARWCRRSRAPASCPSRSSSTTRRSADAASACSADAAGARSSRAQHHAARRHARRAAARTLVHRSVRRVQERDRRSATSSSAPRGQARRSTCATSSTSTAATRRPRGI